MVRLSILDLAPITQGNNAATAFRHSLDYARHAERLGIHRYWLAEHHNIPGIASAATAIVIAHVASGTTSIRVGAGGIMLPNHAPLVMPSSSARWSRCSRAGLTSDSAARLEPIPSLRTRCVEPSLPTQTDFLKMSSS